MSCLLDSNVCIQLINNSSPLVTAQLASRTPQTLFVSTITQLELYYGAYRSAQQSRNLDVLEQFFNQFNTVYLDVAAAKIAGKIRAELASVGTPIGPYDLQIAAIALAHNLTLVTHNTREFMRVEGLQLEDWEVEA